MKAISLAGIHEHNVDDQLVANELEPVLRSWSSQDHMGNVDVPATQPDPPHPELKNRKSIVELRQLWVPQTTSEDKGQVASGPIVLAFQREPEAFLYKELIGTLFNAPQHPHMKKADVTKHCPITLQADRRLGDVYISNTVEKGKNPDVLCKKVHKDDTDDSDNYNSREIIVTTMFIISNGEWYYYRSRTSC